MRPRYIQLSFSFRGFCGYRQTASDAICWPRTQPPIKTDSGVELMTAQVTSENFRGVLCRHCSKPVRVPNMVMKKESESHDHHDTNQTEYHLISRVFVLRCR